MKKFIALAAALMVLLSGFTTSTESTVVENDGIQVCEDLPLDPFPYS